MNVLLLDGTGLAYRSYYAFARNPLRNSRGEETSLTFAFVNTLLRLLERHPPQRAAVVFDAPGRTFRHELDANYKAGRPPMPEGMASQLPRLHTVLSAFGLPQVQIPGVEADDVLATLTRHYEAAGANVYLVTADKDLQQLLSPTVRMLRFRRAPGELEEFGPAELERSVGITPSQVVDYLALVGDSVDNVAGVEGIGAKTARQLIASHGSLEGIFSALPTLASAALRRKLEAGREAAFRARELLCLATDVGAALEAAPQEWHEPDWPRLRELLRELEFFQLLRQLPASPQRELPCRVVPVVDAPALAGMERALRGAPLLGLYAESVPSQAGPERLHALALTADGAEVFVVQVPEANPQPLLGGLGLELPAPAGVSPAALGRALGAALGDESTCKLGHDLKRLAQLLEPLGVTLGEPWFDTMLASYVLNPSRHEHALEPLVVEHLDAALDTTTSLFLPRDRERDARRLPRAELAAHLARHAVALWHVVPALRTALATAHLHTLFDDVEMPLVAVLLDMERRGVKVDCARLGALSTELEQGAETLAASIYAAAGRAFNLHSPRQLGEVLFEVLGLPHGRRTRTGWSTDADVLEGLAAEHDVARAVLEFRTLTKLRSTYTEVLPRLARGPGSRIHTRFNQAVASTGRLSSSDPNLQNIPTRSDVGRRIRAAFVPASPAERLLSADYSQIELRIMAHLSQDRALLQAFHDGGDVHTLTAARIAGCAPEAVTAAQRGAAKTVNFGVIYGMGSRGLAQQLGIPVEEARRFIDEYFASYPGVRQYTQQMVAEARSRGFVTTLLGRRLVLPDLQSPHPGQRAAAERVAVNAPIQGSAADLIKTAMVRVHRALRRAPLRARMILQVHDELLFEVPADEVEALTVLARREMEQALRLSVPIRVDVGVGRNWAEAH